MQGNRYTIYLQRHFTGIAPAIHKIPARVVACEANIRVSVVKEVPHNVKHSNTHQKTDAHAKRTTTESTRLRSQIGWPSWSPHCKLALLFAALLALPLAHCNSGCEGGALCCALGSDTLKSILCTGCGCTAGMHAQSIRAIRPPTGVKPCAVCIAHFVALLFKVRACAVFRMIRDPNA